MTLPISPTAFPGYLLTSNRDVPLATLTSSFHVKLTLFNIHNEQPLDMGFGGVLTPSVRDPTEWSSDRHTCPSLAPSVIESLHLLKGHLFTPSHQTILPPSWPFLFDSHR